MGKIDEILEYMLYDCSDGSYTDRQMSDAKQALYKAVLEVLKSGKFDYDGCYDDWYKFQDCEIDKLEQAFKELFEVK